MTGLRKAAAASLLFIFAATIFGSVWTPAPYDKQFREAPSAPPSRQFPLGADDLGRDRLSRLLYGSRVSLLLATAAALLATGLAAIAGTAAALLGRRWEQVFLSATDVSLSLPWLFLLITVRAMLPLDLAPALSVTITFLLLGMLGWPVSARVVRAAVVSIRSSDFALVAHASGCSRRRLLFVHLLPNLKPVLLTQFLLFIPIFILSEANLGLLGLGVSEPVPSWGNLLRDLENWSAVMNNPWMLAPVALLAAVVACFQLLVPREDFVS